MLECRGCEEVVLRRQYWFSEGEGVNVSFFRRELPPGYHHGGRYRIQSTLF